MFDEEDREAGIRSRQSTSDYASSRAT
jgi:hypothetical protein